MRATVTAVLLTACAASNACRSETEPAASVAVPSAATESAAAGAASAPSDWCAGHGVPESKCTICNPSLIPEFQAKGDWCAGHGLPESVCPACNPPAASAPLDWCAGHGVPESKCTICNPSLIPEFQAKGDWCAGHGLPESVCPACNPEAAPAAAAGVADWCLEHGLPESGCTKCNPSLIAGFQATGDWCSAHGLPESLCPTCNPQEPPAGVEAAAIEARVVRLLAPDIEAIAGFRTVAAQRAAVSDHVVCTARIAFDSDRVAEVRSIVPGVIRAITVELGAEVDRGETLFELDGTRVGEIQVALQASRELVRTTEANLARLRELGQKGIVSPRQVELGEQEVAAAVAEERAAVATLRMAGATASAPAGRYALTAPIAGTVVRRPAVLGLLATDSTSLATIADTSVMWALCDVPAIDAGRVALGQRALVTIEARAEEPIIGEVTWIAAEVDPRTRTVTARAELANPHGRLRANQFARARIETGAQRSSVAVPRAAIQRIGEREVVFVRTAAGVYEPRVVRRRGGGGGGDVVQVRGNVRVGDEVVTTGAILLRTEVLPGSIGAGCCEVDGPVSD